MRKPTNGIRKSSETNTILIPHSPGNLADISAQMRTAMITADLVTRETRNVHDHHEAVKHGT